jgi:sensor c-di-GMP phosphodiesterase-like protein
VEKLREDGLNMPLEDTGLGWRNPDILETHNVDIIIVHISTEFL